MFRTHLDISSNRSPQRVAERPSGGGEPRPRQDQGTRLWRQWEKIENNNQYKSHTLHSLYIVFAYILSWISCRCHQYSRISFRIHLQWPVLASVPSSTRASLRHSWRWNLWKWPTPPIPPGSTGIILATCRELTWNSSGRGKLAR